MSDILDQSCFFKKRGCVGNLFFRLKKKNRINLPQQSAIPRSLNTFLKSDGRFW